MKSFIRHALKGALLLSVMLTLSSAVFRRSNDAPPAPTLTSISLMDRNGINETVTNTDRLCQYERVNFLDRQPYQKVMRVFSRDSNSNVRSYITSYYENGQVKQYLEVINGRANGVYCEWHSNGTMKLYGTLVGGAADITTGSEITWLFDGCCPVWDDCGRCTAVFHYARGELEGPSTYYHPNGAIWQEGVFSKNLMEGVHKIFNDKGCLLQETNYCQGKKEGKAISYYANSTIAAEEEYVNNYLVNGCYFDADNNSLSEVNNGEGVQSLFENGALVAKKEIRDGKPDGEVKLFNSSGRVMRLFHEKDGLKHGEEMVYYETGWDKQPGRPKLSLMWYEGKIQGIAKTWYDNGVQESQRELSNNAKNGLSTAWYRDGSLMLVEEYDMDRLVKGDYFQKGERYPVSQVVDGNGTVTLFDPNGTLLKRAVYSKGKPQL